MADSFIMEAKINNLLQEKMNSLIDEVEKKLFVEGQHLSQEKELSLTIEMLSKKKNAIQQALIESAKQVNEFDRWVLNAEMNDPLQRPVDNLVKPVDENAEQLLENVAKYSAIDDLFGIFDKALSQGKISVDEFLMNLRVVARQQFLFQVSINDSNFKNSRDDTNS